MLHTGRDARPNRVAWCVVRGQGTRHTVRGSSSPKLCFEAMCGIAGVLNLDQSSGVTELSVRQMLALIRHRGPDEFGILLDDGLGLGSARLSIVDLSQGQQPISNEDGSLWIVFNGEIFNYLELRPELEQRGHRFRTRTDTEVLLHLFEEHGPACLSRLNGQFAFAVWNARRRELFLARDRLGVRPLYYTVADGSLVFGSEIKALLGSGRVGASLDPIGLDQVFTCWSTVSPRTAFQGILELPPGHWLQASTAGVVLRRYWQIPFAESRAAGVTPDEGTTRRLADELEALLADAVRVRLRADVPVAAYLSGGLDSAVIAALARQAAPGRLSTFSIAFDNPEFDESEPQRRMADFLGTRHEVVQATHADICSVFPEVIWHCETPVLRTAAAPMFLLSRRVQQRGFKVALTGEGADELLAGYDIFKEAKVRRFWAHEPHSSRRRHLLRRLYPDIAGLGRTAPGLLGAFFGEGLSALDSPYYSHAIRWRNGARLRRFFSRDLLHSLPAFSGGPGPDFHLPAAFANWGPLERAQYLETTLFLSNYLLSSQGDRMGMAHAVEGRYPFLDHRVVEFCAGLPARLKLRVLREKYLLRQMAAPLLPPQIVSRRKHPYRAPIHRALLPSALQTRSSRREEALAASGMGRSDRSLLTSAATMKGTADYVRDLLSPGALRASGLFCPEAVSRLVSRVDSGARLGESDDMALAGIVSAQLVYEQFVARFQQPPPLPDSERVKVCVLRGAGCMDTQHATRNMRHAPADTQRTIHAPNSFRRTPTH